MHSAVLCQTLRCHARCHVTCPLLQVDAFCQRLEELLQLIGVWAALQRLEKVEVGGTHGRALTAAIKAVHADWSTLHVRFITAAEEFEVRRCLYIWVL